jgi:uncharacterized protein (TIGR03905 family)
MTEFQFTPRGVCSRKIELVLDGDLIKEVRFQGGCAGNTAGVAALVKGMRAEEAISRLAGIRCGFKPTSCPDQLARALTAALEAAKS